MSKVAVVFWSGTGNTEAMADLVVAAQRVASLSEQVSAEVYDANHFAGMKEKYRAMSVPCLIIDEGQAVSFGRKNIPQLLDTLQEAKG